MEKKKKRKRTIKKQRRIREVREKRNGLFRKIYRYRVDRNTCICILL